MFALAVCTENLFSLGGYVAREIVRLAPDRVSALVLIATSSRGDTAQQSSQKSAAAALVGQPFKGISRSAVEASLHLMRISDPDLISLSLPQIKSWRSDRGLGSAQEVRPPRLAAWGLGLRLQ
jgi:pimeloyl-ACP methyl ester carboxylesterase